MADINTQRLLQATQPVLAKKILNAIEDDALVFSVLKPSLTGEGQDFSRGDRKSVV